MSNMPCHNPTTCPSGGTALSHVPGSQIEQMCRNRAKRKETRPVPPSTPQDGSSLDGFARRPGDADPYFRESQTWRAGSDEDVLVQAYDYNPESKMLAVVLTDHEQPYPPVTMVYEGVSAETVEELDSHDSKDTGFHMLVEDDFIPVAVGPRPGFAGKEAESLRVYAADALEKGVPDEDVVHRLATDWNAETESVALALSRG